MFKYFFLSVVFISLNSRVKAQDIPLISADSVVSISKQMPDSGITVINFWATWCGPCVHEMPFFVQADSSLKDQKIEYVFISFDRSSDGKRVEKFISKNKLQGRHGIISNYDMNVFIDQIDKRWQGGIPFTIVLKNGKRKIHEGAFESFKELSDFITK